MAENENEEGAEKTQVEQNKPWFVAKIAEPAFGLEGMIEATQIPGTDFKLQIEADQWIKDNAEEDVIYASLRRGKICRATLVRKIEEL